MTTDATFLLISAAKSAAMASGIHRPEKMQDFQRIKTQLKPEELQEATKTWAGVYIAAVK